MRTARFSVAVAAAILALALPLTVHAQADLGSVLDSAVVVAPPPPVSLPAAAPVPLDDPAQLAARAVTAADQGDWRVLAVALLALCGFLLRNKTPTTGKVGAFLHGRWGALLVSAVSAAIGSAIPSLQGGATVRAVIISATASAAGALCGWLTPAPKVAAAGGAAAVLAVLILSGCGAGAGDAWATVTVFGLLAAALGFATYHMRSKGNPMLLALALVLALGVPACGATPKTIAYTATIATVQTIDEGIALFKSRASADEDRIADAAIEACKDSATMPLYVVCANTFIAPRRAPIDKAKVAIRVYQAAKLAAASAASVDLAGATRDVIEALAAVGVKVGG